MAESPSKWVENTGEKGKIALNEQFQKWQKVHLNG